MATKKKTEAAEAVTEEKKVTKKATAKKAEAKENAAAKKAEAKESVAAKKAESKESTAAKKEETEAVEEKKTASGKTSQKKTAAKKSSKKKDSGKAEETKDNPTPEDLEAEADRLLAEAEMDSHVEMDELNSAERDALSALNEAGFDSNEKNDSGMSVEQLVSNPDYKKQLDVLLTKARKEKNVIEDTEIIEAFKDKSHLLTPDSFGAILEYFENNGVDVLTITEDEDNTWTQLASAFTFGMYNAPVKVTFTAQDGVSPISGMWYYVTTKGEAKEIVNRLQNNLKQPAWTACSLPEPESCVINGDGAPSHIVEKNREEVVFLKVSDKAGNVTYACSDKAFLVDTVAPVGDNYAPELTVSIAPAQGGTQYALLHPRGTMG